MATLCLGIVEMIVSYLSANSQCVVAGFPRTAARAKEGSTDCEGRNSSTAGSLTSGGSRWYNADSAARGLLVLWGAAYIVEALPQRRPAKMKCRKRKRTSKYASLCFSGFKVGNTQTVEVWVVH